MRHAIFGIGIAGVIVVISFAYLALRKEATTAYPEHPSPSAATAVPSVGTVPTASPSPKGLTEPLPGFLGRVTKKAFGTYVTPQDSPVSPEKFTGYHTGVDAEAADLPVHSEVKAVADGEVVYARRVSGYGGVAMLESRIEGQGITVLYGHLNERDLPDLGALIKAGEKVGTLGEGNTAETDGERQHLHLGFLKGSGTDVKGYVASEGMLAPWIDPLPYFQ